MEDKTDEREKQEQNKQQVVKSVKQATPTRHPILERLEQHDYDFAGQSLDYEPNLEFDDTDLKQQLEEELGGLLLTPPIVDRSKRRDFASEEVDRCEQDASSSVDSDDDVDQMAFIELHLKSQQAYMLEQEQQQQSARYLESPQDLMDDNFEEAFKSSLFELDESLQAAANQTKQNQQARAELNNRQSRIPATGSRLRTKAKLRLNQLLRSATGGRYGNGGSNLQASSAKPTTNSSGPNQSSGSFLSEFLDNDYQEADESLLVLDASDTFEDIAKYNCVEVVGDDHFGRRIVTIYACRLPSDNKINHIRLLKYIMYTLDQHVESDYCLVYFHYGLNSRNKPKLNFLYQAYRAFDRKYKKNLKALFLVHPTNFIRIVWQLFKPVISIKFGRKMRYVNYLKELEQFMHLEQLLIPKQVLELDKRLVETAKTKPGWLTVKPAVQPSSSWHKRLDSQQFRVSLKFIKEHNEGRVVPPVVELCVSYLSSEQALQTEGLFRRSANMKSVREAQEALNSGETVNFDDYGEQSVHVASVILKSFFRELDEPILTFSLFQDVVSFKNYQHHEAEDYDCFRGQQSSSSVEPFDLKRLASELRCQTADLNNQLTYRLTPTSSEPKLGSPVDAAESAGSSGAPSPQTGNGGYQSQIDANKIRLELAKVMILQKLPDDNYRILKYLFKFLMLVIDRKDLNKMTSSNLAIVFGPNLLWSKDKCASLISISAINHFTEFLLNNFQAIFVK